MPPSESYEYDLAVIGGGSGGMACAQEAARQGAKVVLFDYVDPSPRGTTWGLGGTCVNVGCIPKKLMHYAGLQGLIIKQDSHSYGWKIDASQVACDWEKLVETVVSYVKMLNFSYRNGLRSNKVVYLNAKAQLKDCHTVTHKNNKGEEGSVSAKYIVLACGGRPSVPVEIPGATEYAITSDDIFYMTRPPGKTLIVGGSYIALETAGFLTLCGFDTSVCVRSIVLRGFDRQCADLVKLTMEEFGTKFLVGKIPTGINKGSDGKSLVVKFNDGTEETYDSVFYATGRYSSLQKVGLENVGLTLTEFGQLEVNEKSQTKCDSVFSVGDICSNAPALTPTAIKAGEILARILFKGSSERVNYSNVATTVFTPQEYACVGFSEESAIAEYGKENIEIYLSQFSTLEHAASHRKKVKSMQADEFDDAASAGNLAKLICLKTENERVIGIHFVGPNAGEIIQGYAVAIRLGATKKDFDDTIGIHPTDAEAFHCLEITKASGVDFLKAGGCAGGKCG